MSWRGWAIARAVLALCVAVFGLVCDGEVQAPPAVAHRILIISVDGLRPDLLIRANTPNLRGLWQRGSFSFWARSSENGLTLPTHTSMLTGVTASRHKVWWDIDNPGDDFHYPEQLTLFEVARKAGLTTAMAVGKPKLAALNKPGSLNWTMIPEIYAGDKHIAEAVAGMIDEHRPDVIFAHLPHVDATGHGAGWGSVWQVEAVEEADRAIGVMVEALRRNGLLAETIVLVTADHGGQGKYHGYGDDRSAFVPWVIAGPGIAANQDLTRYSELVIRPEDTFATACRLLRLPTPGGLDGKAVTEVMRVEESEAGEGK